MGRIRQKFIKRIAIDLVKNYPEDFGDDFYLNREKVLELTDLGVTTAAGTKIKYKKTLNKIAGYSTRYVKHQRKTS